jgi:hypothetical protein
VNTDRLLELAGVQRPTKQERLDEAYHHNIVVLSTFEHGELTGLIAFPNRADAKNFAQRHKEEVGAWYEIDDLMTPEEFLQTFKDD